MKRINKLLSHPDFTKNLNHLAILEKDRIYCHHDLSHLLDVARIACLLQYKKTETNLKSTILFSNEIIYASALLHDLGRVLQYEQGLPHEIAGLMLAQKILIDCDFTKSEQVLILDAIQFHRKDPNLFFDTTENKEKKEILKHPIVRQLNISLHSENKKVNYLEDIFETVEELKNKIISKKSNDTFHNYSCYSCSNSFRNLFV